MGKPIDLTGQQFGLWTVICKAEAPEKYRPSTQQWWLCRCACGTESVRKGGQLRYAERKGIFQSCNACAATISQTTHGLSKTPEYKVWHGMLKRCNDPSHYAYKDYGGRGITVCERWERFENFYEDMCPRPYPKATLDRIDNNKGYSKENCRWADFSTQNCNTRAQNLLTIDGVTKNVNTWAKENGISFTLIKARLGKGLTGKDLIAPPHSLPKKKREPRIFEWQGTRLNLREIAEATGIEYKTLTSRLDRGLSIQEAIEFKPHKKTS